MLDMRLGCVLAIVMASCFFLCCTSPSMQTEVSAALRASDIFHAHFAAARYAAIYDNTTPEFKAANARNEFLAALSAASAKTKNCSDPALLLTSYHMTGGEQVDVTYKRVCEQGHEMRERLSWSFPNNKPKLADYMIHDAHLAGNQEGGQYSSNK